MGNNASQSTSSDKKYYRTKIHGLEVIIGDPDPTKGRVAHKTLRFVPYYIYEKGVEGKQRYGYLETSNGSAIKKLDNDYNVEKITEKQFKEATVAEFDDGDEPVQISGFRAPY